MATKNTFKVSKNYLKLLAMHMKSKNNIERNRQIKE